MNFTPTTIKQAVDYLFATNTDEGSKGIEQSKPEVFHMSVGMAMRNEWRLWAKDSPLKSDAIATYGIAHPDDISGLILAWLSAKEKREDFDPIAHCQRYHEHWRAYGTDSLAACGYNSKEHQETMAS